MTSAGDLLMETPSTHTCVPSSSPLWGHMRSCCVHLILPLIVPPSRPPSALGSPLPRADLAIERISVGYAGEVRSPGARSSPAHAASKSVPQFHPLPSRPLPSPPPCNGD
ncbi:unnamed protein product [Mesocestoides corti]|uniref:Uncharacterized protein n=1 Tax=Mesocestoides corti TaxID=53468 RepID=A0A158QV43_MESCO|nr:unnamed protein product [Mesocestoides corti]